MASFNKVLLIGNLTGDPELRFIPSGTAVCEFGIAMNERYKTGDGEQREETCFVDCTAWARQAELVAEYLSKGSSCHVEGKLKLDQWETPDGQKRSKLKVTVQHVTFLNGRRYGGDREQGSNPDADDNIPF